LFTGLIEGTWSTPAEIPCPWSKHRHVGHRAHDRQILNVLVRFARKSGHQSGIRRTDFHIRMGLGD
jgi:hypothetical protein